MDVEYRRAGHLGPRKTPPPGPRKPIIIYTGARKVEWEEQAYLQGATHVLTKPIRSRLLTALLERLWAAPAPAERRGSPDPVAASASEAPAAPSAAARPPTRASARCGIFRHPHALAQRGRRCSSNSCCCCARSSASTARRFFCASRSPTSAAPPRWLKAGGCAPPAPSGCPPACSNISNCPSTPASAGSCFASAASSGAYSEEARDDVEMQKEFELLGAQVAVPMLDRET